MNAVMTQVSGQDYMRRSEAIKRRNAEDAYDRTVKYNGDNQDLLSKLEDLITGKNELPEAESSQKDIEQLDAGQVKQVALPLGNTLEETIDLWRDVRSEAISIPEPTTADQQLAAKASSAIRQIETQISLEKKETSSLDLAMGQQAVSIELPPAADREALELKKRYERAISSYTFQVQAKANEYQIEWPNFYKVA